MAVSLGKLDRVELREVWENEALDFTPWLAEEDSLAILGETLGMDLVLESSEVRVGSFSADIVCVNTDDNSRVLIENQLEKTDHKHLGQLLTYSAGLNTVSIVWISSQFTDEHRASLDWLNEITDEKFRFFGLEVELWRIGDSNLAPRFNIVSKPNEWSRTLAKKGQRQTQTQTPIKELQQEFWQSLKEYGASKNSKLRFQIPRTQHWYNFAIGKTDTKLVALVNSKTKTVTIGFESFGETGTYYFYKLHDDKVQIETELGFSPDWHALEDKKVSAIWYTRQGDFTDQSKWTEIHEWMVTNLEKMDDVFRPRLKKIDPPSENEEDF